MSRFTVFFVGKIKKEWEYYSCKTFDNIHFTSNHLEDELVVNLFPATRTLLWSCLPCKELFKYFDKKVKYICIHFESDRLECDRIVPPLSFHI